MRHYTLFFILLWITVFSLDSIKVKTLMVWFLWLIKEELAHALTECCVLWKQHFILSLLYLSWGQRLALQCTKCNQMALQVNILYKQNLQVEHNFSTLLNSPDRTRNTAPESYSQWHLTFTTRLALCFPEAIRFPQSGPSSFWSLLFWAVRI